MMDKKYTCLRFCLALATWIAVLAGTPNFTHVAAAATNRYVTTAGEDNLNDCSNSLAPCHTIQHAINVAVPGDSVLIAAGENEYTHYGFKEMITKRAVDLVQPDATKSGGILACLSCRWAAETPFVVTCGA